MATVKHIPCLQLFIVDTMTSFAMLCFFPHVQEYLFFQPKRELRYTPDSCMELYDFGTHKIELCKLYMEPFLDH